MQDTLIESLASETKEAIIGHLLKEGYATYARRLRPYKFIVADRHNGQYIPVAAMNHRDAAIIINPNMLEENRVKVTRIANSRKVGWDKVLGDSRSLRDKKFDQLSVLVRHELLHFMLMHTKRFVEHLSAKHPEWKTIFSKNTIHDIANTVEDYEISLKGYDDHDKEVVRLMTLNNEVIGGLIVDDDYPDWKNKTMEEMFDILYDQIKEDKENALNSDKAQHKTTIVLHKKTHSPEYVKKYNEIMALLDDKKYSDGDLADILSLVIADDDDVVDKLTGTVLIAKGE